MPQLSAIEISRLKDPGRYAVGGVSGLYLQVRGPSAKSWILRTIVGNKRRDYGLGGYPDITLADARNAAREYRRKITEGCDPIDEKARIKNELRHTARNILSFDDCAQHYIRSQEAGWKNKKHAKQWQSTISKYASPVLGKYPISEVSLSDVLDVLEPIWHTKNETASRLRGRIERILAWANACGYRTGPNPAIWKGNLDAILAPPSRLQQKKHHAALPFKRISQFIHDLRLCRGITPLALEFLILTASRSGEVRGARWHEIDLDEKVWTISANRMKARREHRIPLTKSTITLLQSTPQLEGEDHVFPAPRGGELSDMALTKLIRDMNEKKLVAGEDKYIDPIEGNKPITVHGFRSTFRDWAGETTNFHREVIEHALAHQLSDKAEAAYARGTQFTKRRELMHAWARFVNQRPNV